jgi:acyl-CoA thioester hydrolase
MSTGLEYRVKVQLRWRDMDMLGHLNQSVYHEMLEEGRAGLILELMARGDGDPAHGAFVVVHVDLDYRHEVRKDHGEVEVVVRPLELGTSSFRVSHDVCLPDGTVAASGTSVVVAWDAVNRRKRTLTDAERALLA